MSLIPLSGWRILSTAQLAVHGLAGANRREWDATDNACNKAQELEIDDVPDGAVDAEPCDGCCDLGIHLQRTRLAPRPTETPRPAVPDSATGLGGPQSGTARHRNGRAPGAHDREALPVSADKPKSSADCPTAEEACPGLQGYTLPYPGQPGLP